MGYFDACRPDQRFTSDGKRIRFDDDEDFIFEALEANIDDLPADAVQIHISREGELLSYSSDPDDDCTMIPFYPSVKDFPSELRKVRRANLTEISRLGLQTDLTTYEYLQGQTIQVAFKYYLNKTNVAMVWHEINCNIRIPKHRNIVPFESLVVDTIDDEDIVVGFTINFVSGGTVLDNESRVFKLKYLKQLIEVLDYINLTLGIVHGDIYPGNLLINSETDDLQIFDFNRAAKLGWEGDLQNNGVFGYEESRNDVKFALFALYEIITLDHQYREEHYPHELDSSMLLKMDTWNQHADVCLDSPVLEYRQVLEEWVDIRKNIDKDITHYKQALEFIDWPPLPEFPLAPWVGNMRRRPAQMRQDMIRRGANFLRWQRPGSSQLPLPRGQRLLATGEIVFDGKSGEERIDTDQKARS